MGHFSKVFSRQLPSFIKDDYPQFVTFVKKYLEFLEEDLFVKKDIHNLDYERNSVNVFLEALKKELWYNLPNAVVDEKTLVTKIKHLYVSKGSEEALKFLFRAFFNKEIEIFLPSSQILKPSDGEWIQEYSIFVRTILGDPFATQGKKVSVVNQDNKVNLEVIRVNQTIGEAVSGAGSLDMGYITEIIESIIELGLIEEPVTGVLTLPDVGEEFSGDYHELVIDRNYSGKYAVGDIVYFSENGKVFVGYIVPTISKIEVLHGGKGFRLGQVVDVEHLGDPDATEEVDIVNGSGIRFKVSRVGSEGEILAAQLIRFGVEYPKSFMINLSSNPLKVVSKLYYDQDTIQIEVIDKITRYENKGFVISNFGYSYDEGALVNFFISDQGLNYTTATAIVSPSPTGDHALITPILENGKVVDFIIYNQGSGYVTNPSITINGDGTGAAAQSYLGNIYYAALDYFGDIESNFSNIIKKRDSEYGDMAILRFVSGPVAKYPGFYSNNKGFTSDNVSLIDSRYYQNFSYVIKSDIAYDKYAQTVLNITHTAGTKMFGEFNLTNVMDSLSVSLQNFTKVTYNLALMDSFVVSETLNFFTPTYPAPTIVSDTFGVIDQGCVFNDPYSEPFDSYFAEDYAESNECTPTTE